jgi:hypothetical protein
MIPELNQPARIASLECGLAKIPCAPEVFASNLGAGLHEFHPSLPCGRLGTFCFLFSPAAFLAVTLVQRNPPMRPTGSPVLIWDIDVTLARALPRNFR